MQRLVHNIRRYVRAFIGAVRLTMKGETPPAPNHPEVRGWLKAGVMQFDETMRRVEQGGLTQASRQEIVLVADGRKITMEMILKSVHYHLTEEYPYLLRDETAYSRLAIHTSNFNDEYRIRRLIEKLQEQQTPVPEAMLAALEALRLHLHSFPENAEADTGNVRK